MQNKQYNGRVDEALSKWREQERRYATQYGSKVYDDHDFMKVRLKAYQTILDQFKNTKLNFTEKMDVQILRGQIRQMNEKIWPNKYMRAGVGIMKLLSRPLLAIGKLAVNTASYLVAGEPYFKNKRPVAKMKTVGEENKPVQKNQRDQKPVIPKKLSRERVLTTPQNGQSIKM